MLGADLNRDLNGVDFFRMVKEFIKLVEAEVDEGGFRDVVLISVELFCRGVVLISLKVF